MTPISAPDMVTTTSYGTWLPGDLRGYVEDGIVLPANPGLLNYSKQMLVMSPVFFTPAQQEPLLNAIVAACREFDYDLLHLSIESWHLHWVAGHGFDPVPVMVGRLKNRMRRRSTSGGSGRRGTGIGACFRKRRFTSAAGHIARHEGHRVLT